MAAKIRCKLAAKALASAYLLMLIPIVASAQSVKPTGPVKMITEQQYQQMVQDGYQIFPITSQVIEQQNQQVLTTYEQNQAIVDQFIAENPGLAGIAQLFAPPTNPKAVPTSDGNYLIAVTGQSGTVQTVETMGPETLVGDVAASIATSSDPVQQLSLYQWAYTHYSALYDQLCTNYNCTNLTPPSSLTPPEQLQNASLDEIESALHSVASQGSTLYSMLPFQIAILPNPYPASCAADIGENLSLISGHYGDQTSSSCTKSNPIGILANFNWAYEDQLTCVKEQGARGTCHIFASTSAMEQAIAADTGLHVNLSEQDFMENEKLNWGFDLYHDGGSPLSDLNNAATNNYKFAYEDQWDYNPSWKRTKGDYTNSCTNYPYPSLEPGCSDTAPQAPVDCVISIIPFCFIYTAPVPGTRSPYMSNGGISLWHPKDKSLSVSLIQFALAVNAPVALSFTLATDNDKFGYIPNQPLPASNGGHVVHIVAYVDNSQLAANPATATAPPGAGGGYFVIKNSWGTCSGDLGYRYMPVAFLENRATGVVAVSETH